MGTSEDGLEIDLDLRAIRAEAERDGTLREFAVSSSELAQELRLILRSGVTTGTIKLNAAPTSANQPPAKMDLPQIVDSLSIILAPVGIAGLLKLVLEVIKICSRKVPTRIVLKSPRGEIEVAGPDVTPDHVRELTRILDDGPRDGTATTLGIKKKLQLELRSKRH